MSIRKGDDVIAGGNTARIESQLNSNSVNPVQNRVIANKIQTVEGNVTDLQIQNSVITNKIQTIEGNVTDLQNNKQNTIVAGDGIVIDSDGVTINVGGLDCGTMS